MPKLELEAAVLGTHLRTMIQTEMSRFDSKKLEKKLKLMSGTMSQLILIRPIMERVALSLQKFTQNGLQYPNFCKTLTILGKM